MKQLDVAIIGGGISGLATAFYLARDQPTLEIAILESRPRWGGLISTLHETGFVCERGPDSLVAQKPEGRELVCDLGLERELISSRESQQGALLWTRNQLHPFPVGILMKAPVDFKRLKDSTLLSESGWRRALQEPDVPPLKTGQDESVHDFFTRRFGLEVAELLAAPLVSGVYGGDSRQISIQAAFPRLFEAEQSRGQVSGQSSPHSSQKAGSPFLSLRRGMGQLIAALISELKGKVRLLHREVRQIGVLKEDRYRIELLRGESVEASQVVIATQATAAARMLALARPEIAAILSAIPYSPSLIACFGFEMDVTRDLPGTGLLVPAKEREPIMAATWVHHKFSGRCPPGQSQIRCFMGAEAAGRVLAEPEERIASLLRDSLGRITGITARPLFSKVFRWRTGLPQYSLGHSERVADLRSLLAQSPGLHCAGNYFDGVGISDAIRSAKQVCRSVLTNRDFRML